MPKVREPGHQKMLHRPSVHEAGQAKANEDRGFSTKGQERTKEMSKNQITETMLPICDETFSNAPCRIDESTEAAQSLKDQTKSKSAPHNAAVLSFKKLSGTMPAKLEADQVKFLQAALRSHLQGDGIPSGTSESNRGGLKDHQTSKKPMPTLSKTDVYKVMKETFGAGLSDELLDRFVSAYEYRAKQHAAVKLAEMVTDNPELMLLASAPQIDAAAFLSQKIQDLEEAIYLTERDNARLVAKSEARHHHSAQLQNEDVMYGHQQTATRRNHRSSKNLSDDLHEADIDNSVLMEARHGHIDPKMAQRAAYLSQTARPDFHQENTSSARYLSETFEITKSN